MRYKTLMRKWYYESFKRLADNLNYRYVTQQYATLISKKRKTWFSAYISISKTIYRDRVPIERDWREFCRKILSRFYRQEIRKDWDKAILRISNKKWEAMLLGNSNKSINLIVKKLEKRVFAIKKDNYSFSKDYTSAFKIIAKRLDEHTKKELNLNKLIHFKLAIDILIRKLYKNYSHQLSFESIIINKIDGLNQRLNNESRSKKYF